MGAFLSTLVYQPLLLGTATVLMIIALIYQGKSSTCGKDTENWGSDIFKLNMGISIVIVISAIIINFISGFTI
jgi:hypothetical protein